MKKIMLGFLLVVIMTQIVVAFPSHMNLQGRLTDASGSSLFGTYNVSFDIYDAASGGNKVYESSMNITTDSRGVYDIALKNINKLPFLMKN